MRFPSKKVADWCEEARALYEKTSLGNHGSKEFGWCECHVEMLLIEIPPKHREQFLANLFWSVWIDEVLFTVAKGPVYDDFQKVFPFPKLFGHFRGHAAPWNLILPTADRPQPRSSVLVKTKEFIWGNAEKFLASSGRLKELAAAKEEFSSDVEARGAPDVVKALSML